MREVSITIERSLISPLGSVKGFLDTDSGDVFDGFVGRRNKGDGLWHGVLRFSPADPDNLPEHETSISGILKSQSSGELFGEPEDTELEGEE